MFQEQSPAASSSLFSPEELNELALFQLQMEQALYPEHSSTDSPLASTSMPTLSLPRSFSRAIEEQPRPSLRFSRPVISVNSEPRYRNSSEPMPSGHHLHVRPASTASVAIGSSFNPIASRSSPTLAGADSAVWRGTLERMNKPSRSGHQLSKFNSSRSEKAKAVINHQSETKKREFAEKVRRLYALPELQAKPGTYKLRVRRDNLVDDAYTEIMRATPDELKQKLMVKFEGEEGLDFGGVSRELFHLLSRDAFSANYGLFKSANGSNNALVQINPASDVADSEHLRMFHFLGRLFGIAIIHRQFLSVHLVPSFYKLILGRAVCFEDLEAVDEEYHRGLKWMLSNSITDILDETFTTTEDRYGKISSIELRPGGNNIAVTDANKQLYVDLIVNYRVRQRIQAQFSAFMDGFTKLVPSDALTSFDEYDLELLICGVSVIDVDDWEACTEYNGYTANDAVVRRFWQCVRSWPEERKTRLLQFVTGSGRVPVSGFKDLRGSDGPRRFLIERCGAPNALPKSHTCFNRLDLPPYTNSAVLERKLTTAIE